ncbi:MAG: hypothetical protein IPL84_04580 [Chitinophagaceae bacterium]|nr:hypothetical protein [Chitinophagaceae bacterium]
MKYLVIVSAIVITSCSSRSRGEKYPDQVRTNFVNGCAKKLPPEYKANCECMLEQVEKKYSFTEYMQVENDIKAGKDVASFMAFTDSVRQICFPKK